jgi:Response regulator containing CheY-like receiver domain and AraC-type DNA-binding domain
MYTLLIVDDEYQARMGLRELVDWQSMGVEIIGDADDGETALPLIDRYHPDILLTDIRMNRMDGLSLALEARKRYPQIEIVFISGYADAEYLRGALRLNAYDYLYKPIRMGELSNMMRALVKRIENRRKANEKMARAHQLVERSRPLLIERLIRSWIEGTLFEESDLSVRLAQLDISFPLTHGLAAAALQPEWSSFPRAEQADAYLLLLSEKVKAHLPDALALIEDTGITLLAPLHGKSAEDALLEGLKAIWNDMRGITEAMLSIGISSAKKESADIPEAVREAQQALECRMLDEHFPVLFFDAGAIREIDIVPSYFDGEFIERHLLTGNADALLEGINAMLTSSKDAEHALKRLMYAALRADTLLQAQGIKGIDALAYCRDALKHRTIASLKRALENALQDAASRMISQPNGVNTTAVAQVIEIIKTRYADRLTIENIAEEVHYSPAHLSTLFRQETGMTIGDALFRTRLNAAMTLLRTGDDAIASIAFQSGYTDVQYFYRVFKRYTGMTPVAYRKKVHSC